MKEYIVTATRHIKSLNNSPITHILRVFDNDLVTYNLFGDKVFERYDAYKELEHYVATYLNGVYNEDEGAYYIDGEKVYLVGVKTFTYNGITYKVEMADDYEYLTYEYCNNCCDEVVLKERFVPQICPNCGEIITPCNLCEECVTKCPLRGLIQYIKETRIEIITLANQDFIRVNGIYLQNAELAIDRFSTKLYIGRKVFWLDPCFRRMEYHTSAFKTIESIKGEIVTCTDGTEVLLSECYL